jgi:hypothetical protein
LSTNFRYLLFLINALFIGVDGGATSLEGVYIEDKGSVVFFSDEYKITNLKSEDKIVLNSSKVEVKKEAKLLKNLAPKVQLLNTKKRIKKAEIKIPVKHIIFSVKNSKKSHIDVLQPKDTNIIFYISIVLDPFLRGNLITNLKVELTHVFQNQRDNIELYSIIYDFSINCIQFIFLGLSVGLFFYSVFSKKAKNSAFKLKRGPPYLFLTV